MTSVWGILNLTPDSFSDGGEVAGVAQAVARAESLTRDGADVIDVGGESTRPGAVAVDAATELARILPAVSALAPAVRVSVDTYHASTAQAVLDAGARIINDVTGGLAEPDILRVVADFDAEVVLGHWRGPSERMYEHASYVDVAGEVCSELAARVEAARRAGVDADRIIVDPGLGFAKHGEQNWQVLRELDRVASVGFRMLVGTSRKGFLLGTDASAERRDSVTALTSVLAAEAGAWGVRVHNVRATRDALDVARAWRGEQWMT